jgi:hypothetical protein
MGWSLRVLRHRAAAQRTLLVTVVAVALVGSSLLGTFALLLHTSEHDALNIALDQAAAPSTVIDVKLPVGHGDPTQTIAAGEKYLDDLLGAVPSERDRWIASPMYFLAPEAGPTSPLAYLATNPAVPENADLLAGEWPTAGTDAAGRVPISVPKVAADAYGWTVGTELPVQSSTSRANSTFVIAGIHHLTGLADVWRRDVLGGLEHDPRFPVPNSYGFYVTDAWGPLIVAPDALTAPASVDTVTLVASPQLADVQPAAIDSLRARLVDAQATLVTSVSSDTFGATVTTQLATTIDVARHNLAVTRVSLVIVGLMLVVLAVTVLLLAARLLADRRAPEQTLMSSRGASGRQLLGLAALEAAVVALLTTALSPWLAELFYGALTSTGPLADAGLGQDPGRPPSLWITCVVSSFALAAVLLGPLLRRRGSVVDAEQQLVRQDRRGGLARSGVDIALVALAGLAVWQLRSYGSPVAGEGPQQLDPVLVVAPALLLLAGAVLALRLLPLVTRVGERLASRSRSLISPLAAWEVGRRPGRAAGAVLLLTLALAVGSFSQSFLSTWRSSQIDQADLAGGADVRFDPMARPVTEQADMVTSLPDVQAASAIGSRGVGVGRQSNSADGSGRAARLLALDTSQADDLLRGRIEPSWGTIAAPLQPTTPVGGIELPGTPSSLRLDIEPLLRPMVQGSLQASVVVEDAFGSRTALELPPVPLGAPSEDVAVPLPPTVSGLQLVGFLAEIVPGPGFDLNQLLRAGFPPSTLDIRVQDLQVVERPAGADADTITPVSLTGSTWTAMAQPDPLEDIVGAERTSFTTTVDGGALQVKGIVTIFSMASGTAGVAATTFADPGPVPVVATDTLLDMLSAEVGATLSIDLGGVAVPITIVREVPYLPSLPRGAGLLVDRDVLTRSTLLQSWTDPLLDEWWLQVPDSRATALVDHLRDAEIGAADSLVSARAEATDSALRIGVQAALWIVTAAAVLLAVAGFAMSATVAVRTRRLELARLQALGASRQGLVGSVLVEHAILGVLGLLAGLTLGAVLARVVSPLVTVSASGGRPVPTVVVEWPWPTQLTLVTLLVGLVAAAVALTANSLLRRASGELLRLGDER